MDASEKAVELFKTGACCSQAVFVAFAESMGMDAETAMKVSAGLGGGVGRMREVCGTVTGMAMVAGFLTEEAGSRPANKADGAKDGNGADEATGPAALHHAQKHACYALVQELSDKFKSDNGSIVCRELLGLRSAGKQNPEPAERNGHYYRTRPCEQLVGYAAALLAEKISGISL